ncbi:MAG: carboxypeptidase-like regulatory domain-containing protein [Actinobacteria bacterium]|nr:carboxypeptidase-like regulatory domain-containing protein [Actinomycetota bacterium]
MPARLTGTVRDDSGQPLAAVRILSKDLSRVLTRTDARGRFAVPCTPGLVFAPYAFAGRAPAREPESSPGIGNLAYRTRDTHAACGRTVDVTMPAGGVVEGTADAEPGAVVALSRVVGGSRNDADGTARYGWFTTTVRPDRTYRITGLATGRYSIETSYDGFPDEATFLDVHEGRTTDGSYTYTVDSAVCYEQPPGNPECDPTPTPSPSS